MLTFTRSNAAQHGTYQIDHAGPCQEYEGYLPGEYSVKYGDVISGKKCQCNLIMLMTKETVEYFLTQYHGNMDNQGVMDGLKPFKLALDKDRVLLVCYLSFPWRESGWRAIEIKKWTDALQLACPFRDWTQYNNRRAKAKSKK